MRRTWRILLDMKRDLTLEAAKQIIRDAGFQPCDARSNDHDGCISAYSYKWSGRHVWANPIIWIGVLGDKFTFNNRELADDEIIPRAEYEVLTLLDSGACLEGEIGHIAAVGLCRDLGYVSGRNLASAKITDLGREVLARAKTLKLK